MDEIHKLFLQQRMWLYFRLVIRKHPSIVVLSHSALIPHIEEQRNSSYRRRQRQYYIHGQSWTGTSKVGQSQKSDKGDKNDDVDKGILFSLLPALTTISSQITFPPHPHYSFIMLRVALTGAISRATARSAIVSAPRSAGKLLWLAYLWNWAVFGSHVV